MWQSADQLPAGWPDDVDPGSVWHMTIWTLLIPAALFFFGAGMLFPACHQRRMEPFRSSRVRRVRWWRFGKTSVPARWPALRHDAANRAG